MFQHLTFTFIFNITPYVLMKINTTDPPEFMEWRYLIATHTSGLPPRVNNHAWERRPLAVDSMSMQNNDC